MKQLLASLILMLTAFTGSSQTLKPQVRLENKDTLFCFSFPQAATIAAHLVNSRFCDSLQILCEKQVGLSARLIATKDSSVCILEDQLYNHKLMVLDYQLSADLLQRRLIQQQKIITRQKWVQRLCAFGLITLSGAYLYQTISNR